MAINVACPECKQKLRVPEDWLGQSVECPDCGKSFQAAKDADDALAAGAPGSGPPPLPAGDTKAADDEEFAAPLDEEGDGPDKPRKKKRAKRRSGSSEGGYYGELRRKQQRMMTPHRGVHILVLGLLSILCSWASLLALGSCACGYYAYQMGSHDLSEMQAYRMDPSGRGLTIAGRIMGIIGVIVSVPAILLSLCFMLLALIRAATGFGGM
jgi:hypothetical protein